MTELLDDRTATVRAPGARRAAIVALAAAGCALLDWALWTQAGGVDLRVDSGGVREVGAVSVVVSALVCTLLGAALLWWMAPRAGGTRNWTRVALAVTAVSLLLGPVAATSLAAGLGLASLHLVVATVAIVGLRRWPAERAAG